MATLGAAILAAPENADVYIYHPRDTRIEFPDLGASFAGVANGVHLSSWPQQLHTLVANNLPGSSAELGTPGAMGLFEFGPGTDASGLRFSHFEAEASLNVWSFIDNTNGQGIAPEGEIYNVIARGTADSNTTGFPNPDAPGALWDSNAGIVHLEEGDKENPVNEGWEIHHSIFEHALPPEEQSPNQGGVYILAQHDIEVHHMLFRNLRSGVFFKHASTGSPDLRVFDNVIEDCDIPIFGAARGATIENNLIVGESTWSVIGLSSALANGGEDVTFRHNTFTDAGFYFEADGMLVSNFVLENNIFAGSDYFSSVVTSDGGHAPLTGAITAEHNLWEKEMAMAYPEDDPQGDISTSLFNVSPAFVGGGAFGSPGDFALADGSPGQGASSTGTDLGCDVSRLTGWMWD